MWGISFTLQKWWNNFRKLKKPEKKLEKREEQPVVTKVSGSTFDFADNKSAVNIYDVSNATGDGSTDDSAEINAAIATLSTAGLADDTTRYLDFDSGVFACKEITLKPLVVLRQNGSRFLFNGSAGEYLFQTLATEVVYDSGLVNIHADLGVGSGFDLHSVASSVFDINIVTSNSSTNTILRCVADSSAGASRTSTRNFAANHFTRLHHTGTCGTAVYLEGNDSGNPSYSQSAVVTLNTFSNFIFDKCDVMGYEISKWVDSNDFNGIHRCTLNANNAIGVRWGNNHQSGVTGVYNNTFQSLAVDQFGDFTGRIGCDFQTCRNNRIYNYYMDTGGVSDPTYVGSHLEWDATETTSFHVNHQGRNQDYASGKSMVYERGVQTIGDFKYTTVGAGLGVTTGTTEKTLIFTTKKWDHGLGYTTSGDSPSFPATDLPNYDTATGFYTVPMTGIYQFTANAVVTGSVVTDTFYFRINIFGSGGGLSFSEIFLGSFTASGIATAQLTTEYDCVEGQYATVSLQRRSGTGTMTATESDAAQVTFSGHRVHGS
jgi:hypothetical protein